jgi:hypothetical protein
MNEIKISKIDALGMPLEQWRYKSCIANFGVGEDWATLYDIHSMEESKGHATYLLTEAKKHYEDKGMRFAGSVALNDRMRSIYQRLDIKEYDY